MKTTMLIMAALLACGDKDDDTGPTGDGGATDGGTTDGGTTDGGTTDGGADGGTDGGADGGTDGGADGGTDGGTDGGSGSQGLLTVSGSATVTDVFYQGNEQVMFVADEGKGETLCQVSIGLESTGTRDDCGECDWAFDLEVTIAKAVVDKNCDAVGYGAAEVKALPGTPRAYGFIAEYFGHAPVLMAYTDGAWNPVDFATFDPKSGAFSYSWEEGYFSY